MYWWYFIMLFVVEIDKKRFEEIYKYGFPTALGYWFWNMAVMIAPEDTGNLKRSITLASNSPRKIRIRYDLSAANYTKFLEEGVGPVKKYKGFISVDTTAAITEQAISWIITGKTPMFLVTSPKPFVSLKSSSNQPFSWERAYLKQADVNAKTITAKSRMEISKIREMNYTGQISRAKGERVESANAKGSKIGYNNRNFSKLHQIYMQRKNEIVASNQIE